MSNDELIEKTNKAITELVQPKTDLLKAYNYYNCIRDKNLFKYLEEAYGVNTPTTINFIPLIRKHVDAILGEYLSTPVLPKISCKDLKTIANMDREKLLMIAQSLHLYLSEHLQNSILLFLDGKNINDGLVEQQMKDIVEDINDTFVSEYEIAALNVLEYVMQSRETDMLNVRRNLMFDLLVTGYALYKVEPTPNATNITIKVLSPLNTFIDRNLESPYVRDCYRIVMRHWMNKLQILNKYGKDMSEKDKQILDEKWDDIYDTAMFYVRAYTPGVLAGVEVTPGYPNANDDRVQRLLPVYEVEWIETDKDYVMLRYSTIRIGEEIYILNGKDENVIRSQSNPSYCGLSVNGIYFLNRGFKPWSMVLACQTLLDKYDLLHFYRDNLIANSGTVGDWIDLTLVPASLGATMPERVAKWLQLKKQGIGILDSSQEGRIAAGAAPLNTIFNGYDDTVKVQAIQAIELAIQSIEATASSITGVFKERLGLIETRDAVSNVEVGLKNSFIITKLYNHQMDLLINELLLDCLNTAKVVYKKGLTGTIILGDKYQRVFTALPEHFTVTDHDIRILTSSDVLKDIEQVKSIIPEFVKSGQLPPDIIIEAMTTKSLPDLKYKVRKAMKLAELKGNQIQLLTLQNEELLNQMKEASLLLLKMQLKVELLNEAKLKLEQQQIMMKDKLEWYKAQTDRDYKQGMIDEAKRRTDVELKQLTDGNPYNDKIRQVDL